MTATDVMSVIDAVITTQAGAPACSETKVTSVVTVTNAWASSSAEPRGIRSPREAISGASNADGTSCATAAALARPAPPAWYAHMTIPTQQAISTRL